MSLSASTSAASPHPPNAFATRLHRRWLWLARVGWLAVALCSLALFVGSLPAYYLRLQMPCVGTVACNLNGALSAAGIQALRGADIQLGGYAAYTIALNIVLVLIWSAVGFVIFWRRSDDWVALLVAVVLVTFNAGQQDGASTALAFIHPVWNVPVEVANYLSEAPIGLFVLLFPSGRFAPRWTRWVVAFYLVLEAFLIFPPAHSPLNAANWPLYGVAFIGFLGVGIFSQLYRYRRVSNPVQRQQIKWAVFGISISLVLNIGLGLSTAIPALNQPGSLYEPVLNTLYPLALLPIPLSIGVAILHYRLWDIDDLINKALVYGLLTGLLAALYAGLIISLESLAGLFGGQAASNPLVLVVSTLAIAALFLPVRTRIQGLIDRRFYRKKYDAEKTLATFSATLRNETDLEQLREHLLAAVNETMQPAHVSLWLRQPAPPPRAQARHQEPSGDTPKQTSEH